MFIFFNDTATTEIYTLSLHDALPISRRERRRGRRSGPVRRGGHAYAAHAGRRQAATGHRRRLAALGGRRATAPRRSTRRHREDRKSTRLNSSHANISYAVFCLKKK